MLLTPARSEDQASARWAYVNRLDAKGNKALAVRRTRLPVFYRKRFEYLGVRTDSSYRVVSISAANLYAFFSFYARGLPPAADGDAHRGDLSPPASFPSPF